MYKNGFGINNLQWLICYKAKPNQIVKIRVVQTHARLQFGRIPILYKRIAYKNV